MPMKKPSASSMSRKRLWWLRVFAVESTDDGPWLRQAHGKLPGFWSRRHLYEDNGLGRVIDRDEAHRILEKAEETGLVLQPSNARNVSNICTCCGCCCQILKNLKRLPKPADGVAANYYAVVDRDECIGCETCLERCRWKPFKWKTAAP